HIGSRPDWQCGMQGELESAGAAELWPENKSRFITPPMTRRLAGLDSDRIAERETARRAVATTRRGTRVIQTGFQLRNNITIGARRGLRKKSMNTISISRRQFARLLGAGAAVAAVRPALSLAVTPATTPVTPPAAGASVVRLSSNENPYGPSTK